jgi:hypothetical protein
MAHLISGQEFRSEAIIAEKIANQDFEVYVSPAFEFAGDTYQVVMDGHHSYDAAILAGVEPVIIEQTATDNDKIGLLQRGLVEDFLEAALVDRNEYVFISTERNPW